MARASEQTLRHARLAGFRQWQPLALEGALLLGPRPVDEALQTLDATYAGHATAGNDLTRALLNTMLGRVEEGLRMGIEARRRLNEIWGEDLGTNTFAETAWLAGDREAAGRGDA